MKCKVVRQHLLASAKPARPPAVMAEHLAQCAICRAFQRRLVNMERLVPELPVPASTAKADCVQAVLHSDTFARHETPEIPWRQRERALRKVAITFAMAAGLLFFALVWYAWQHHQNEIANLGVPPAKENRLEDIVNFYDRGALLAAHPRERFERLTVIAQKLHDKTKERALDENFSEVSKLSAQYKILMEEGILADAARVPEADRKELLGSVAEQFSRASSEAHNLATQHPMIAQPLDHMAIVANNARSKLRELAGI